MRDLDVLTQGSQNSIRGGKKSRRNELVKVTQAKNRPAGPRASEIKDERPRSARDNGDNSVSLNAGERPTFQQGYRERSEV